MRTLNELEMVVAKSLRDQELTTPDLNYWISQDKERINVIVVTDEFESKTSGHRYAIFRGWMDYENVMEQIYVQTLCMTYIEYEKYCANPPLPGTAALHSKEYWE